MKTETPGKDGAFAIITSVGEDRTGIVASLSGWILENDGNIEDSRMSQLGGEFATLILVQGDSGLVGRLEKSKQPLEKRQGLSITVKEVKSQSSAYSDSPVIRYTLSATSMDHAGIIHQVSLLLSKHGINIVSANTKNTPAPFSGAPVFQFQMTIDIPSACPVRNLRAELNQLCEQLDIDYQLQAS